MKCVDLPIGCVDTLPKEKEDCVDLPNCCVDTPPEEKKSYVDLPNGCIDAPSIKNLILSKFHAFETRKLEECNKLVLQSY